MELLQYVINQSTQATHKQAEDLVNDEIQSLRRDRDRLLQGLDSLPGLVGYVDLDLKIVFANRLIEQWYQRPLKDLVGMHLKTLFTEEHFCTVEALLKRVLSGEAINEEREICYPDGITRMAAAIGEYAPEA